MLGFFSFHNVESNVGGKDKPLSFGHLSMLFLDGGCVGDGSSISSCVVVFQNESERPPESVQKVKEPRRGYEWAEGLKCVQV